MTGKARQPASSVMILESKLEPIADLIAHDIVEGSVRKSGRRVRVTAQLIQADTGHHTMAERCDRDLTDLFELQDEIATAIAAAIEPELLKFERDRIAERPEHNEFDRARRWEYLRPGPLLHICRAQDVDRRSRALTFPQPAGEKLFRPHAAPLL
jgi:hypothetical protein